MVEHAKFARIYVEIDLRRKLLSKIKLKGKTKAIVYEEMHFVYFNCWRYGHKKEFCLTNDQNDKAQSSRSHQPTEKSLLKDDRW